MDADPKDPGAPMPPEPPSRAPLARVTLARRVAVTAAKPVRVVVIEEQVARRKLPRAAVVGGSVWVIDPEHAVEELPLGE